MPRPFKKLHPQLWDKHELITEPQYKVLTHLSLPDGPLLFMAESETGRCSSSVTNSESSLGFSTQVDVRSLIFHRYLKYDAEWSKRSKQDITAYRISRKGREAVVQYELHLFLEEFRKEQKRVISQKLMELRKTRGVTTP